jgi:hypothetical protein
MRSHHTWLLTLLFLAPAGENKIGEELLRFVRRIEGTTNEARRAFIKEELRRMNVPFRTMPFDTIISSPPRKLRVEGENIIVPLGKGSRHLVVGAHYDAVPNSPGANDNGGGVAVVLGLIRTLKEYGWNVTVDFCFFDREEVGLVGSAVYVREFRDRQRHLAMVNLDVEGTGEELYIGPVGGGDDEMLMKFVRSARDQTALPSFEHRLYPSSDHLSFAAAKLENISISIVPKGDGDKIVRFLSGENQSAEDFPTVLRVMHTPRDSSTYMTPEALTMSYEFTRTLLVLLNESQRQ